MHTPVTYLQLFKNKPDALTTQWHIVPDENENNSNKKTTATAQWVNVQMKDGKWREKKAQKKQQIS